MATLVAPSRAVRLDQRIRWFDNDPRTMLVGIAAGAVLAVIMTARLDEQFAVIGWSIAIMALIAPSAGISALAVVALLREPAGLGPIGFNATIVAAAGLGVAIRLLVGGLAGRRVTVRPEFVAIGAFLALSTYQFLRIAARVSDERERFGRAQLTDVAAALVLIVIVAAVLTPRSRPLLIAALLPGIVLAAVAAIVSLSPELLARLPIGGLLPARDISARGTGIFYNPNYLGQAMALSAIIVLLSRGLGLLPQLRHAWVIVIPVVGAVIASFSRSAWFSLVVGVVATFAGRGRRALATAAVVGALVAVLGYQTLLAVRHAITFGDRVELSGVAQTASDSARLDVYVAGVRLFFREPIMGVGIGQFHYESPRYLDDSPITYAHNLYLEIAAEQGIAGIVGYLAVLLTLAWAVRRTRDEYGRLALAMLAAFAVGSLFAEPLTNPQTTFILSLAVGAALVGRHVDDDDDVGPAPETIRAPNFRPRAPMAALRPEALRPEPES